MKKYVATILLGMLFLIGIPTRADTANYDSQASTGFTGEWKPKEVKPPVKSDEKPKLTAPEKEILTVTNEHQSNLTRTIVDNQTEILPNAGDSRASNLLPLATMSALVLIVLMMKLKREKI